MDMSVIDCRGTGSGFNLYLETEKKIATFLKTFEEDHITWLEEILLEARKTFSRRSLTLLPKTPSNAKRNRRIRPTSDDTEDSSSGGSPPAKKRVQRKSKSLDPFCETEAIHSSPPKRTTRSTRASARRTTQERSKRTTRSKQTKSVTILENSEESSSEKEPVFFANTEKHLPEKDNRVRRLIDHHEKIISESSDDDFHSPKRLRKFVNKDLDTVPETVTPPVEKLVVAEEPSVQTCTSEGPVETLVNSSKATNNKDTEIISPVKESSSEELIPSDGPSIEAVVSDESATSKSDEVPAVIISDTKVGSSDECKNEANKTTDSKESNPEELSEQDIVVEETKDENSMEEDSLNEGSNVSIPVQTSFMLNSVRMSVSMSKSKKRSSLSRRRLSRDSSARSSLRASKRLSILAKQTKLESCEEVDGIDSNVDEKPKTRLSMMKHRLSLETNVRKSVRQSLRTSKRLSAKLHKSKLEGSESKVEEVKKSSNTNVQLTAECSPDLDSNKNIGTTESEESSNERSVSDATPEPKKQTRSRTKQRKAPQKAVKPVSSEVELKSMQNIVETTVDSDHGDGKDIESDASEKSPTEPKTTRTRTKIRKTKKSLQNADTKAVTLSEESKSEKASVDEPERKKSTVKNKRSCQSDEEVEKKGKKMRLSRAVKVEVIDISTDVQSQSGVSEQFDDSLEPSSADDVKEIKRRSRRGTQDSDPGAAETVSATTDSSRCSNLMPTNKSYGDAAASSDDSCDEDVVTKTTSPVCPPEKVIRPHPQSFLNKKKDEGVFPTNSSGIITSFIKRNTPKKKTIKERQEEIKAQIREKQRKEEEIRKKLQQERKNKMEEQKRKREERAKKAAEARERRILQQNEKRQKLEEFYEHKQAFTEKQKEEKKREDMEKKKLLTKKRLEAEERRRLEEENRKLKLKQQEEEEKRYKEMMSRKKEFEEQERLQKQEEWRQQQELRKADQEKQRLEEAKRRRELEIENEREQLRLKEQREKERREIEKMRILEAEMREKEKKAREEAEELKKIEAERIRREQERKKEREHLKQMMMKEPKPKLPLSTNSTALNTTVTKEPDMKSPQSYDITPQRIYKPSTDENYCIDDINSDDSTDDEDHPRKKIPSWAQGAALKAHLIHQIRFPVNIDKIFGPIEPPDLTQVFQKKRTRYLKRTSSAVWNSPIFNKY